MAAKTALRGGEIIRATNPQTKRSTSLMLLTKDTGKKIVHRGLTAAKKIALAQKHTLYAMGAAAGLGYMEGTGQARDLPQIKALGLDGTLALAGLALTQFTKSPTVAHLTTGVGSVFAYKKGREWGSGAFQGSRATSTGVSGSEHDEVRFD